MTSVTKTFVLDAPLDTVWAALREFGDVHRRLVPGFVTHCLLEDDRTRVVTFFSGLMAKEVLVSLDDEARRIVYAVTESPLGFTHHNAAAQIHPEGDDRTRFVWTTDVLPDEEGPRISWLMDKGVEAMHQAFTPAPAP
ncbi:MAG: SRPBCC family protein [Mycobacteriaceae bacterium]|nr:SRPBCC family protein [Mycobacteriaceae bacterium]